MTQIFRVTVRGRFADLDEPTRAALLADADALDAIRAHFTADGRLTYDARLDFFSFRIERRERSDDGADRTTEAFEHAVAAAAAHLDRLGAGYRYLKPAGSDMASVWR